jgi:hypothetical protein
MKLLSCIDHGSPRLLHFGVAAGHGKVSRGRGIKGQVGEAIGGEVVLYLLRLARDDLGEVKESTGHGVCGLLAQSSATIRGARGTLRHKRD